MPLVAAGTGGHSGRKARDTVEAALSAGIAHIDTAYDYGNQKSVGEVLAASGVERDSVFITTKVSACGDKGIGPGDCRGDTLTRIHDDIEELSSSGFPAQPLDLVLLHHPPCVSEQSCLAKRKCSDPDNCAAIREQWAAMQDAYSQGLVRAVGVSNYCRACFDCLGDEGVQPMVNQVSFHLGMGPDPQGFVSFAKERGFVLQAYSPLGHGHSGNDILSNDLTSRFAKDHGKTPAQVALKWLIAKGAAVTTSSSSPEHLKEDLDLFDWELSEKELAALDTADFAKHDHPSQDCDEPA